MMTFIFASALLFLGCAGVLAISLLRDQEGVPKAAEGASLDSAHLQLYQDLRSDLVSGNISSEEFEEAERGVVRRIAAERGEIAEVARLFHPCPWWLITICAVLLGLFCVGTYTKIGMPSASRLLLKSGFGNEVGHNSDQLTELARQLEARLAIPGEDPSGWILLGRTYSELGDLPRALLSFGRAVDRLPKDPDALADYADALALANGRNLSGKPLELVRRALAVAPNHVKALGLAGTADFDQGNYKGALRHWERALKATDPESGMARALSQSIEEVRGRIGAVQPDSGLLQPAETRSTRPAATGPETVAGVVSIAPMLSSAVQQDNVVFISAHRAGARDGVPLAAVRVKAAMLPYEFSLSDANSMAADFKISSNSKIEVIARVAMSGGVKRLKGDLEGRSTVVAPGERGLRIVIDKVVE